LLVVNVLPYADQVLKGDTGGCWLRGNPLPSPWLFQGSSLTCIFLEHNLEPALFDQLYLITARLARTIGALVAGDENEGPPLKPKLPDFVRAGFKE